MESNVISYLKSIENSTTFPSGSYSEIHDYSKSFKIVFSG